MFADSERSANMLYAAGLFIPDPFVWAQVATETLVIVSPLEYGRVCREICPGTRVLSFAEARKRFNLRDLKPASQIAGLSRYFKLKSWQAPRDFPLALARQLDRRKVAVRPAKDAFFPERERKTAAEVEKIRQGVQLAEAGLNVALEILRHAQIARGKIRWQRRELSAEILRGEIDAAISRLGGLAAQTIVAPGIQGADPHHRGRGPIRPGEPIIIDIFPRVAATGYFGDLTRTVLKGKAPEHVRRAYNAVRQARDAAKDKIRAGASARNVHRRAAEILAEAGFKTDKNAKPPRGFFHGTGHGLGLEVHEAPRLSDVEITLQPGHVVTVEPGLYYPEWGGVRLEDVVCVEDDGCRTLTSVPSFLEID